MILIILFLHPTFKSKIKILEIHYRFIIIIKNSKFEMKYVNIKTNKVRKLLTQIHFLIYKKKHLKKEIFLQFLKHKVNLKIIYKKTNF